MFRRAFTILSTLLLAVLFTIPAHARDLFDHSATLTAPATKSDRYEISLQQRTPVTLHASIAMTRGRIDIQLLDPAGKPLITFGAQQFQGVPFAETLDPGAYTLFVAHRDAVGTWRVRVDDSPGRAFSALHFLPGVLILAVSAIGTLLWCRSFPRHWRWFWVGALLWTLAVALKFLCPVEPVLHFFNQRLPTWAYYAAASAYIGLLTGITEVTLVFLVALCLRSLAATSSRAIAIGAGAGLFEAFLLGLVALAAIPLIAAQHTALPQVTFTSSCVQPAERIIVIPCHIAARLLALFSVATRRWRFFWAGFLFLTSLDAVAGLYSLTGMVTTTNPWLLELLLTPFALVCIPIIRHFHRLWPTPSVPAATPLPLAP